jgi:hypothetical protein
VAPLHEPLPPVLEEVALPTWADDLGVAGAILVPAHSVVPGEGPPWARTDWWAAAGWYLNATAERAFEDAHGPIHSYSFHLKGWDSRLWQHAWANRIGLFLRRWAARLSGADEDTRFGPLPEAEVLLTHDVDAVIKTAAIRLKQTAFHLFNAISNLRQGRRHDATSRLAAAARFFTGTDDYWCFDRIMALEEERGLRSVFNFYGGGRRGPRGWLMDPGYDVCEPRLSAQVRKLAEGGWGIGLHQSFAAFADSRRMAEERLRVETAAAAPVTSCRQHWLRFSFRHTWRAQQEAGLGLDTTLGFNDRSAFRNGAALRFHPWDPDTHRPLSLEAVPLVMMDSHLYDYATLSEAERSQRIASWIGEVQSVRGTASVLWHPQVWAREFGWDKGYEEVLNRLGR